MTYSLTWMADVLRDAGLAVREIGGWTTRGHGNIGDIRGVLLHHTAGPANGNYPSENVVVIGRPGLDGPLANLGLARDGTWLTIAAGVAWHAGTGYVSWCGRDNGNQHLIGVEAENTGTGQLWTPAQLEAYPRGVAALLAHLDLPATRALGHKEWTPRKPDPANWPGDLPQFRTEVQWWMDNPEGVRDDMAEVPQWQWDRAFDRILRMSAGVEGQNFDGEQYAVERAEVAELRAMLQGQGALLAKLVDDEDITPEELEKAFTAALVKERAALASEFKAAIQPELAAIVREALGDDNEDLATAIIVKMGDKLAQTP